MNITYRQNGDYLTPMMEAFETAYKKRRTKNGKRA